MALSNHRGSAHLLAFAGGRLHAADPRQRFPAGPM